MAKVGRKKMKDARRYFCRFRVSKSEKNRIKLLAQVYAGRDISIWLRYAALNARPKILKNKNKNK